MADEAARVAVDQGDETIAPPHEPIGTEIALDRLHVDRGFGAGAQSVVLPIEVQAEWRHGAPNLGGRGRSGEDAAHEVCLDMQLFARDAELAATVAVGRVEHREVGPGRGEFQKLEQQRVAPGAGRSDLACQFVEDPKPESPERQHFGEGDALAGARLSGRVENSAVVARVRGAPLFQAVQHRLVVAAHGLADGVFVDVVIRAHCPRALDRLLHGLGVLGADDPHQRVPSGTSRRLGGCF